MGLTFLENFHIISHKMSIFRLLDCISVLIPQKP